MEDQHFDRPKRFISTLTFAHEAERIEDLPESVQAVIACASDRDMTLLEGETNLATERVAVETISYGSEKPWRNWKAEGVDAPWGAQTMRAQQGDPAREGATVAAPADATA